MRQTVAMQAVHAVQVVVAIGNVLKLHHALQALTQHGVTFNGKFFFNPGTQRFNRSTRGTRGQGARRSGHGVLHNFVFDGLAGGMQTRLKTTQAGIHTNTGAGDRVFVSRIVKR